VCAKAWIFHGRSSRYGQEDPSGTIEQAKVVLGAVGSSPAEVPKAAALLEGHKPTDDLLQSVSREVLDRAQAVGTWL